MKDLQILKQLLAGNHLSKEELKRARIVLDVLELTYKARTT